MIARYVFVKLKPEYGDAAGLAELVARSRRLAGIEGVRELTIGKPADADANSWDVSLALRFDSLQAVQRYLADSGHEAFYEGFLQARVHVIKAWNFEV
jgi:hypothetical protein